VYRRRTRADLPVGRIRRGRACAVPQTAAPEEIALLTPEDRLSIRYAHSLQDARASAGGGLGRGIYMVCVVDQASDDFGRGHAMRDRVLCKGIQDIIPEQGQQSGGVPLHSVADSRQRILRWEEIREDPPRSG
jgi:hypothetical protein